MKFDGLVCLQLLLMLLDVPYHLCVSFFENESVEYGDPTTQGILKQVLTFQFLANTHLLGCNRCTEAAKQDIPKTILFLSFYSGLICSIYN